jgi:hypothetical protein
MENWLAPRREATMVWRPPRRRARAGCCEKASSGANFIFAFSDAMGWPILLQKSFCIVDQKISGP